MKVWAVPLVCVALSACALNPYNPEQKPQLQVSADVPPQIRWTPQGADVLRVYLGDSTGGGYGENLLWLLSAKKTGAIQSPLTYGETPPDTRENRAAPALRAGETYTLVLRRPDQRAARQAQGEPHVYETSLVFKAGMAAQSPVEQLKNDP